MVLSTNFFSWKTQVRLGLQQLHIHVNTDDPGLAKDMELAYFQRHLSVDEYVNELKGRSN